MTGLSVLYAKEATKEREWSVIPDRDRPGRLREVYWVRRAELKFRQKRFLSMILSWHPDRTDLGRVRNDPGDGFFYCVGMVPHLEQQFEWLEVTEEFTTVAASQIEGAMRAWNGIPDNNPVNFDEFREDLRLGRPSRIEQRRAADRVIASIEKKLSKASYQGLLVKYGYGTLVVGMPLWFAVLPDDPFRAENALDDFFTRTALGLDEIGRSVLRRRDCPFRNIIVIWDTTPHALQAWRKSRSDEYGDAANASLENPMGVALWEVLSDFMENVVLDSEIPESEATSMCLYLKVTTPKKVLGTGPFTKFVEAFDEVLRKRDKSHPGHWAMSKLNVAKLNVAASLWKLLCFLRVHGVEGLEQWIVQKFSLSHRWRVWATRRRARLIYRESRRRGQQFSRPNS